MNEEITTLVTEGLDPALVSAAKVILPVLLIIGAILKHAFPKFPNRLIPLLTLVGGTVAFVVKSGNTTSTGILSAILVAASATGIHSGLKNTFFKKSKVAAVTVPIKHAAPILLLLLTFGCAASRQYASTTSTNPTNGVVTVTVARSSVTAVGDAKNIIEKVRASAGKTSSVGASGIEQETSSSGTMTNAADAVRWILTH